MTLEEAIECMQQFLNTVAGNTNKWPLWTKKETEALKVLLDRSLPLTWGID